MNADNGVNDGPSIAKRAKVDLGQLSTANATAGEILNALEQDDDDAGADNDVLDEAAVKRLTNHLEKKASRNREMRIKYSDEPQKFVESEVELNAAIQDMHTIAAQVEMYPALVKFGTVQLILQLLGHENMDIVAVTCNLLQEYTDLDAMYENEDCAKDLIDELMQSRIIETIVQQGLKRLNEKDKDEEDAVQNLMSVMENLFEFRPEAAETAVDEGLFQWLLVRATKRGAFTSNKQFASQHLAVILQNSTKAQERLVDKIDGIDLLLRALATFKKHDPASRDEAEHMENLYDTLCAALAWTPNRQVFLDGEGLQLMNLLLREKKQAAASALKVLSHVTVFPHGATNCDKFIEIYGLRTLFPLFMKSPAPTKKKDTTPAEHDEHVISVIDALLAQCSDDNHARVLQKFEEHEYEKVDRCVELFLKYKERVEQFTARLRQRLGDDADADPELVYGEQLNNGLYTLQRVALVLAEVVTRGRPECAARAAKLLRMKTRSTLADQLEPIKVNSQNARVLSSCTIDEGCLQVLHDLRSYIAEEEEAASQRTRVERLLASLVDVSIAHATAAKAV